MNIVCRMVRRWHWGWWPRRRHIAPLGRRGRLVLPGPRNDDAPQVGRRGREMSTRVGNRGGRTVELVGSIGARADVRTANEECVGRYVRRYARGLGLGGGGRRHTRPNSSPLHVTFPPPSSSIFTLCHPLFLPLLIIPIQSTMHYTLLFWFHTVDHQRPKMIISSANP